MKLSLEMEPKSSVSVPEIMQAIRERMRVERRAQGSAYDELKRTHWWKWTLRRVRMRALVIRDTARSIREVPPGPATLRAKMGAIGVRILQRSLFWLLPGLGTAHYESAAALEEQQTVIEALMEEVQNLRGRVATLEGALEAQREDPGRLAKAPQ